MDAKQESHKGFNVPLTEEEHRRFKVLCIVSGVTMGRVIGAMITDLLDTDESERLEWISSVKRDAKEEDGSE